jgi:hypothetical protein
MLKSAGSGVNNLKFKTPSPNLNSGCASAFGPLTQPPPPPPPAAMRLAYHVNHSGGHVVAPGEMHHILNPYGRIPGYKAGPSQAGPSLGVVAVLQPQGRLPSEIVFRHATILPTGKPTLGSSGTSTAPFCQPGIVWLHATISLSLPSAPRHNFAKPTLSSASTASTSTDIHASQHCSMQAPQHFHLRKPTLSSASTSTAIQYQSHK